MNEGFKIHKIASWNPFCISFTCKPVRLFHVKMVPGYPLSANSSS